MSQNVMTKTAEIAITKPWDIENVNKIRKAKKVKKAFQRVDKRRRDILSDGSESR